LGIIRYLNPKCAQYEKSYRTNVLKHKIVLKLRLFVLDFSTVFFPDSMNKWWQRAGK